MGMQDASWLGTMNRRESDEEENDVSRPDPTKP